MDKAIITVVGKDRVGIMAAVCTYLAQNGVNILDISQTITGGFFNMMMITDIGGSDRQFGELSDGLESVGKELGMQIKMQKEDIFNVMHRV
ncbi:MAG: ACT domain-containing protein [Lachnospiraceae bacterium]|jgi:ACT domain-containing protein